MNRKSIFIFGSENIDIFCVFIKIFLNSSVLCEERSIEKIKINSCENNTEEAGNLHISSNSFDAAFQKACSVLLDQVIRKNFQSKRLTLIFLQNLRLSFSEVFEDARGPTFPTQT